MVPEIKVEAYAVRMRRRNKDSWGEGVSVWREEGFESFNRGWMLD